MDVVELFSGIGAQAKALQRINIDYRILATCDWDINAIIAYDLIHNENHDNLYENYTEREMDEILHDMNLSANGKTPMNHNAKIRLNIQTKQRLLSAINRTNNLVDITNIHGEDLPNNIDLLTYSFPCQDLSLAGNWHFNRGGIDRNSGNRSSLLWEVERLLMERNHLGLQMPRFLLMENVTAILSPRHFRNFEEWKENLRQLGYINEVFTLNATDFGVPQTRKRTYMISVYIDDLEDNVVQIIRNNFDEIDENNIFDHFHIDGFNLDDALRRNYENPQYLQEALLSNPNITASRQHIYENNIHIDDPNITQIPTITTKQDRHPNSGVIDFPIHPNGKMPFRYLTPRECFLLMGFDEEDYQSIIDNNFKSSSNHYFFTRDKLNKMAGNSICVNVLESLFQYINHLSNIIG